MIHNKYFHILKFYLGDYKREIYGRELIGKIPLAQKTIALTLQELEQKGLLYVKKRGSMKNYCLNIKNPQTKDTLIITEVLNKNLFLEKHQKIDHIFKQDNRIIGIFGSYAKGKENKDSDIDIFIVGKNNKQEYTKKGKEFGLNISVKQFTEQEFKKLLREKNPLINEIISNHIILFNVEKFIKLTWSNYYDIN